MSRLGSMAGVLLCAFVVALPPAPPAFARETLAHGPLQGRVFGYLPYWELDETYIENIRWDLLSDLVYFAIELSEDGSVYTSHGWANDTSDALSAAASLHGVRYVLAVLAENFDRSIIDTMVSTPESRSAAIETILAQMAAGGASSVNIDFEHPSSTVRDDFSAFIRELTDAVHEASPDGQVTVATPKIYYMDAYDLPVLAAASDGLMVMGYGYHAKNSARPGPNTPLYCRDGDVHAWYYCVDERTTPLYHDALAPMLLNRVIFGLPFYGWDWPSNQEEPCTAGAHPQGCSDQRASLFTFDMRPTVDESSWRLGPLGRDLYLPYQEGEGWRQIWLDDSETFDTKVAYTIEQGFGGIGIWALGYEGLLDDLWVQIADRMTEEEIPPDNEAPVADAGADQRVEVGALVSLDGSASRDPEGAQLRFMWSQRAGPQTPLMAIRSATPRFIPETAGSYRFELIVSDGALSSSPDDTIVVAVAPALTPDSDVSPVPPDDVSSSAWDMTEVNAPRADVPPALAEVGGGDVESAPEARAGESSGCGITAEPSASSTLWTLTLLALTLLAKIRRKRLPSLNPAPISGGRTQ